MRHLIFIFSLTVAAVAASGADGAKPVFVKAKCVDKVSSSALSSFREALGASERYRLVSSLDDAGRMDVVLSVQMSCTQRDNVVAVASVYGIAKCFGPRNCHVAFDVTSLRADFCDSSAAPECGRALFKAFDDYMNNPNRPPLQLD